MKHQQACTPARSLVPSLRSSPSSFPLILISSPRSLPFSLFLSIRTDLPDAGLANITATAMNLLGFEAPSFYEASLITTK